MKSKLNNYLKQVYNESENDDDTIYDYVEMERNKAVGGFILTARSSKNKNGVHILTGSESLLSKFFKEFNVSLNIGNGYGEEIYEGDTDKISCVQNIIIFCEYHKRIKLTVGNKKAFNNKTHELKKSIESYM